MDNATARPLAPRPVDARERLDILDIIRGFALGGVFLSNVYFWLSGGVFVPEATRKSFGAFSLAAVISKLYALLVSGKFMTIFTFLFGLGMAVQFGRAEERGDSASRRYTRRALALILLGALHCVFLWYGDITHMYALLGFGVLLLWKRSTKTLVIVGILLSLLPLSLSSWGELLTLRLFSAPEAAQAAAKAKQAADAAFHREIVVAFQGDSYLAVMKANARVFWHQFVSLHVFAYHVEAFGHFLLGYALGRAGWFRDIEAHRRAFRWMAGLSALTGVVFTAALELVRAYVEKGIPMDSALVRPILMPPLRTLQVLGFAVFYASAITLLYQRAFFRRLLLLLAPSGRIAITNYYSQSLFAILYFYGIGFGHFGDLRLRNLVIFPIAMYTLQVAFSHVWLRYFEIGPVEWVLRSLTYSKALPFRRRR